MHSPGKTQFRVEKLGCWRPSRTLGWSSSIFLAIVLLEHIHESVCCEEICSPAICLIFKSQLWWGYYSRRNIQDLPHLPNLRYLGGTSLVERLFIGEWIWVCLVGVPDVLKWAVFGVVHSAGISVVPPLLWCSINHSCQRFADASLLIIWTQGIHSKKGASSKYQPLPKNKYLCLFIPVWASILRFSRQFYAGIYFC